MTADPIDALRDEHAHVTSCDGCCHCGDGECDGIGCIAVLDPDDERDHDAIDNLHALLREGQAWRVMRAVIEAGADPTAALLLAEEALAHANNMTATATCEGCGRVFSALGPCDDRCTSCRVERSVGPQ